MPTASPSGRFVLDGEDFQLATQRRRQYAARRRRTASAGAGGTSRRCRRRADGSVALELRLASEDGDQGYPGRLDVPGALHAHAAAANGASTTRRSCDRATVVNLTHHDYFNLAGGGSILDHRLTHRGAAATARSTPALIPQASPRWPARPSTSAQPRPSARASAQPHPQLLRARGYDHNWVLDRRDGLRFAARLEDPASGRVDGDRTPTEPGLQFYSGNFLDGSLAGSAGQAIRQGDGLCLETQHFPDAPNRPDFPSTVLRPGRDLPQHHGAPLQPIAPDRENAMTQPPLPRRRLPGGADHLHRRRASSTSTSQKRCIDFMIDAGSQRPVHPGQLLRAVRAVRRRARAADARRSSSTSPAACR